jgi:hypothetical protein
VPGLTVSLTGDQELRRTGGLQGKKAAFVSPRSDGLTVFLQSQDVNSCSEFYDGRSDSEKTKMLLISCPPNLL